MLTHRTNVLFSPEEYSFYSLIAQEKKVTLSVLIRQTLAKNLQKPIKRNISVKIRQNWKMLRDPTTALDYVQLVHEGRKHE